MQALIPTLCGFSLQGRLIESLINLLVCDSRRHRVLALSLQLLAMTLQHRDLLVRQHASNFPDALAYVIQSDQAVEHVLELQNFRVLRIVVEPGLDPNSVVSLQHKVLRQVVHNYAL